MVVISLVIGHWLFLVFLPFVAGGEDVLTGIRIEPEYRCSVYDSDDYSYSQALEPAIVAQQGGRIYSPYSGRYFRSTRETDIEHIVARSEAHDSGLCSRPVDDRAAFASDLDNLTLAAPRLNRYEKVAKDPAEWLPQLNRCWYVGRVVAVKREWGLSMDSAEAQAIREVLTSCDSVEMVFVTRASSELFWPG